MPIMDPLPSINIAYSMVLRVEKQRQMHTSYIEIGENSALSAKYTTYANQKGDGNNRLNFKGRNGNLKVDKHCSNCGKDGYVKENCFKKVGHCTYYSRNGHIREYCFKLNGYLDWYKNYKDNRVQSSPRNVINFADTPLSNQEEPVLKGNEWSFDITELVQVGVSKLMKGNSMAIGHQENFAHYSNFASLIYGNLTFLYFLFHVSTCFLE